MKSCFKYFVLLFGLNFIEGSSRCHYQYSSKARAWYKYYVVPETWFNARLRCSLEGAVLASPTTPEIRAEMINIINTANMKNEIFTGIHATFSQEDYYTIEGTPLSEIQVTWSKNEPDNKDNKENCITLNCNGELADHCCEETRPYICYRSEKQQVVNECGTHDPEYSLDKRTGKCYKFHTVPRTFSRAFMACSAERGHLAIVNSEVESTVLKELFGRHPASQMAGPFQKDIAFIGFHNWGETFDWRTIHGQTLTEAGFSKFSQNQPDNASPGEYCGGIFRNGLLDDLWCNSPAVFICEKSPE